MSRRHRFTTTATAAALAAGLVGLVAGPATAATTATVSVTNSGYSPAAVTIAYGGSVSWQFTQGTHSVTDSSKLGLFGSGSRSAGSSYTFAFLEAGTFAYDSTVGTKFKGTVAVPTTATPATGSKTTYFDVRWASTSLPTGYSEQVQMKEPGSKKWISFVYGTPDDDATFRAADWGNLTGTYQLRSKLYKGNSPKTSSGWSPVASVSVS
jgi:plastocyanin